MVTTARFPLPLHFEMAQDASGVPAGQQGLGVPEVWSLSWKREQERKDHRYEYLRQDAGAQADAWSIPHAYGTKVDDWVKHFTAQGAKVLSKT